MRKHLANNELKKETTNKAASPKCGAKCGAKKSKQTRQATSSNKQVTTGH
jgi:uncharacterized low-complexity protein